MVQNNAQICYRFEHTCVAYDKALAKYVVNTANLNATVADNTPRLTFSSPRDHFFETSEAIHLFLEARIWSLQKVKVSV